MSIHSTARARSRPQLVTSGVGVERGGRLVLTDISIAVTTGTRLGVVGENGRGKSTLLHQVIGRRDPESGDEATELKWVKFDKEPAEVALVDQSPATRTPR